MSVDDKTPVNKMLSENPLIAFSVYTHLQVEVIRKLGNEITDVLDRSIKPGTVESEGSQRVHGQFWLWVLGAYEITRTMKQAESCLSNVLVKKLTSFKKRISLLRIPFAKQEYKGSRKPIQGEALISRIDTSRKDFVFGVKGKTLSIRSLLNEFESIFANISSEDILYDHRQSKKYH